MTPNNDKVQALIPLDERLPAVHREQGDGSILQRMTRGALEIAQRQAVAVQVRHHKVVDYELAEPDYRQVLLWAEQLALAPEEVLERLAYVPCGDSLQDFLCLDEDEDFELEIKDGHFRTLVWDSEVLPLEAFEWLPGLSIGKLAVIGNMPAWPATQLLPSLRHLFVQGLGLIRLDLNPLPNLIELWCSRNQLSELNLSLVPGLTGLWCWENQLTELDLNPVTGLIKLLFSRNQLTELDLRPVPRLTKLCCFTNKLTELDLSPVPGLTELWCSNNQLTELDLSPVPGLTKLDCWGNQFTELELNSMPGLTEFNCNYSVFNINQLHRHSHMNDLCN